MNGAMDRREFLRRTAGGAMGMGMASAGPAAFAQAVGAKKAVLKKAICFGMAAVKLPLEDKYKLVKDCGFDGVEVGTMNDEKQVEQHRAAAEKAGIRIHSIMNSGH